jgi:hypothetical protein
VGRGEDLSWFLSPVGAEEAVTESRSGGSRSQGPGLEDPGAGGHQGRRWRAPEVTGGGRARASVGRVAPSLSLPDTSPFSCVSYHRRFPHTWSPRWTPSTTPARRRTRGHYAVTTCSAHAAPEPIGSSCLLDRASRVVRL